MNVALAGPVFEILMDNVWPKSRNGLLFFGLCNPQMNFFFIRICRCWNLEGPVRPVNLENEVPTPPHLVYFYINQCVQLKQIKPNLAGSILISAVILVFHILLKLESASSEKEDALSEKHGKSIPTDESQSIIIVVQIGTPNV